MKKIVAALLLSSLLGLADDLYTSSYMQSSGIPLPHIDTGIPNSVDADILMKKKRVFWASLHFDAYGLTDASRKELKRLIDMAQKRSRGSYYVSLIGHTSGFTSLDDSIELNAWSTFWQDMKFRRVAQESVAQRVNKQIESVYDILTKSDIEAEKIYTENRMDRDPISTEATKHGKSLNRRVAVALYY